jgi:hypothetical protein
MLSMRVWAILLSGNFAIGTVAIGTAATAANPQSGSMSSTAIVNIYAPRESRTAMVPLHEATTNLDFNCPKAWQPLPTTEKDSVLKVGGATDGHYGELKISRIEDVPDVAAAKNIIQSGLERAIPGSSKLEEREVRFGTKYQFTGTDLHLSFTIGEAAYRDRMIFFKDNGHLFIFSFICKNSDYAFMGPVFDQILSSVHHSQGSSVAGSSAAKKELSFERYSDKSGQIAVDYPAGWKFENRDPGKELDVKFAGANSQGLGAELNLARIDKSPTLSLDQFVDTYEDTYMKDLKDLRRQSSHRTTFGISHVDGQIHYSSFTVNGHPMRQAAAFFADSGHYYCVALNSALWPERESRDLFERVLASVKLSN